MSRALLVLPLTLGVGFIILALSIPYFSPVFGGMIETSIANMLNMATPAPN
jgi:flagellar biosynthesis protein FliR